MSTMDLLQLAKICQSEKEAFHFLFKHQKEFNRLSCPECRSPDFYFMHPRRLRFNECKRVYHPFFSILLNELKISNTTWLWLVKLFELEVSARKASFQVDLSYPTTLKGFDTIQCGILQNLFLSDELHKGEIEVMNRISEEEERGKGVVVLVIRSLCLGSWKGEVRFQ